ncbi:response regulator receiver domain-containing protein [Mesonia algae]|uniref:Response regulator receiver domain-containing protein n=2 Tax=Mesonia algae TaxID=213248 RepID=A0A2W7HWY7_9FLAO|nr:response regulator receiver domain-containing protein [Mesonia algae]
MSKLKIACIIDDDPIFIFGLKKVMNSVDFAEEILVYKNGEDALENLIAIKNDKETLPEVILLDLNMPIMDGWQFLDEFTQVKVDKKITVYIVSSSIDPLDYEKTKKYNHIENYIIKPVQTDDLKTILKTFKSQNEL